MKIFRFQPLCPLPKKREEFVVFRRFIYGPFLAPRAFVHEHLTVFFPYFDIRGFHCAVTIRSAVAGIFRVDVL